MTDSTTSAYQLLGGEPAVRALVARFYDLMHLEAVNPPCARWSTASTT